LAADRYVGSVWGFALGIRSRVEENPGPSNVHSSPAETSRCRWTSWAAALHCGGCSNKDQRAEGWHVG